MRFFSGNGAALSLGNLAWKGFAELFAGNPT